MNDKIILYLSIMTESLEVIKSYEIGTCITVMSTLIKSRKFDFRARSASWQLLLFIVAESSSRK